MLTIPQTLDTDKLYVYSFVYMYENMTISEWCGPQRGFLGSNGLYHYVILAYWNADTLILFSNWPRGVSVLDIALSATNLPLKAFLDFFFICLLISGVITWYSLYFEYKFLSWFFILRKKSILFFLNCLNHKLLFFLNLNCSICILLCSLF